MPVSRRRLLMQTASFGAMGLVGAAAFTPAAVRAQPTTISGFETLQYTPMVADPFTWAWFGTLLAEGAVAWTGGQILSEFLGTGEVDLERLVKDIADLVRAVVRQEIQQATLLRLSAEHRALQNLFQIYLAGCDRGIWNEMIARSNTTAEELKGLGLPAHSLFLIAMAQHIVLIQEGFGRTQKTKDLLTPLIERASAHLDEMHSKWRLWHDSRYGIRQITIPRRRDADRVVWQTMKDGLVYASFERGRPRDDAITTMNHIKEEDWVSDTFPRFVKPSIDVQENWARLLRGSFEDDEANPFKRICI